VYDIDHSQLDQRRFIFTDELGWVNHKTASAMDTPLTIDWVTTTPTSSKLLLVRSTTLLAPTRRRDSEVARKVDVNLIVDVVVDDEDDDRD
jgi:hypothetical protein